LNDDINHHQDQSGNNSTRSSNRTSIYPLATSSGFSDIPTRFQIMPTHAIDSTLEESLHSQSLRPPDMLRSLLEIISDSRRENESHSKFDSHFGDRVSNSRSRRSGGTPT